jgi:hypothetical protein
MRTFSGADFRARRAAGRQCRRADGPHAHLARALTERSGDVEKDFRFLAGNSSVIGPGAVCKATTRRASSTILL